VITVDAQHMIIEDDAARYGLDRSGLWQAIGRAGPGTRELVLRDGLRARMFPVTPGRLDDGVVLLLGPGQVSPAAPGPVRHGLPPLERAEARVIAEVLAECGGNKSRAADRLGISRGTLYQRLRRYGLGDEA
jgi:sigma-54 dependent transcriptional regulator, acetoin dehydrogenase operon transcriptional activator AcoR